MWDKDTCTFSEGKVMESVKQYFSLILCCVCMVVILVGVEVGSDILFRCRH